ncbi:MAG: bifunctional diaminohydroxyphosphoribosylaminopyrimidine deaminase/5-amino-6-(5-phosphoribosylamino)uracil reductase RibD [Nocardioidaceae bacterium]
MRRALMLAATPGVPEGPNPRVGAVLLSASGEEIAAGYHRGAGTSHAEVEALRQAGELARGATAVITLEPCNHTGRTGPCAQALIAAGMARVVFAQADVSRQAAGGAIAIRAAGVGFEGGLRAAEADALNPVWTRASTLDRPLVTWKFAATLDGRSAAADGTSRWITGNLARADVHRLRARCDAILVGTGTALADDPRLTVRSGDGTPFPADNQPLRAVMGMRELPSDAAVLDDQARTVLLRTRQPAEALAELHSRGCMHVWLEGGPRLAAAFLAAGVVDEVIAYVAPLLLGAGPPAVEELGITTLADATPFALIDVTRLGDDVRLTLEGKS